MREPLPAPIRAWVESGSRHHVGGRAVFVRDTGTGSVPTVLIHGFPGSSYDWAGVAPALPGRVIAVDLPGYGASAKDPAASYSLFAQADLVEHLLADLGVQRCAVVAHDMGDTVTAELASRQNAGHLGFDLDRIILTNGSIFIDQARLTRGQRLTLRLPGRVVPFSLPEAVLRRSLQESFTAASPPPPGALAALIALIRYDRGDRLLPVLIRYIEERRVHQDRWTRGLVEFAGPLTLLWGELDPIAVTAMARRMQTLRPSTVLETFPDLGHWPGIEDPDRLAAALRRHLTDDGREP